MDAFFLYGFGVWFLILFLAVLNGIARDKLYKARVGDFKANQISSIILCLVIFGVSFLFIKIGSFNEPLLQYFILGLIWMALTVAFEFLFFHYVTKHTWEELIDNYNIAKGNLWIIVVITTVVSPVIAGFFI